MVLVTLYIISKAYLLDITNDEAYTFYNVKTFWIVEIFCTGNTHWLIFSFIKLINLLGFEHVFNLRLFSVLSAIGFFILVYRFLLAQYNLWTGIVIIGLLILNPYITDYFCLARGYASGLFFQLLSIIALQQIITSRSKKWTYIFLISTLLSVISNFNFFYFFSAIMPVYLVYSVWKNGLDFFKSTEFKWWLLIFIGCSLVTIKALNLITVCSNDIGTYGGTNFFTSIFGSQFLGLWNYQKPINTNMHLWISYGLFFIVLSAIVFHFFRHKIHNHKFKVILSIILIIMFVLAIFNKLVLNVLYPIDRTAVIFYLPICFVLIMVISEFKFNKLIHQLILYMFGTLSIINFLMSVNFHKSIDFPEQQESKQCFEELDRLKAKQVGLDKELFGVYRNYYQKTSQYKFQFNGYAINTNDYNDTRLNVTCLDEFDYLVLSPPYKVWHCRKTTKKYSVVKYYKKSGILILKK